MTEACGFGPAFQALAQKAFGDALLKTRAFLLIPSVVSSQSWNLVLRVPADFI